MTESPETPRNTARVVVLGDSLITAAGDSKGLGWLGRVISRTPNQHPRVDFFELAVPDETTAMLAERWAAEVQRRFSTATDNYLVLALSNADPAAGVSLSRSRLNVATILDECARAGIKTFVVGPTPHRNPELNREVGQLSAGFEDVCNRRGIRFVDCFTPLVEHEGWNEELSGSEYGIPGQLGYGLVAWLVLNRGWYDWLELEAPQS